MTYTRRHLFQLAAAASAFAADPVKSGMIVRSTRPEDLESPVDAFNTWITPIEKFYVRSHHYTPKVSLGDWKLNVRGLVNTPVTLTLDDLKKLPRLELVSVMECAGNGRGLYDFSVPGLQWDNGAVGNGRWAGVRLGDVLRKAGIKNGAKEVLFDGADVPVGTMPEFKRTVPIKKALDPNTILAYEMNGQTLPVSHGFPLRVIVPGWAGDSWVKWLTSIEILDKDFDGFFMTTAYRHPGRVVAPGAAVDPKDMSPLTSIKVKSVITSHRHGDTVAPGPLTIAGVAWSGESPVQSVEVSVNGGRTWSPAQLGGDRAAFAWRLWQYKFTPPREAYYNVMARARDAAGDTQPFAAEWNPSGYLYNVVQPVGLNVAAAVPAAALTPARVSPAPSAEFKSACIGCHEMDVIEQQKLTRGQWEREVDKMGRWGAQVKSADREGILRFLTDHFGPRRR